MFVGLTDMQQRIAALEAVPEQARHEAQQVGADILAEAQLMVPVASGALRDSGKLQSTDQGFEVVFEANYSAKIHEDLTLQHSNGQAKFLELPWVSATDRLLKAGQAAFDQVVE